MISLADIPSDVLDALDDAACIPTNTMVMLSMPSPAKQSTLQGWSAPACAMETDHSDSYDLQEVLTFNAYQQSQTAPLRVSPSPFGVSSSPRYYDTAQSFPIHNPGNTSAIQGAFGTQNTIGTDSRPYAPCTTIDPLLLQLPNPAATIVNPVLNQRSDRQVLADNARAKSLGAHRANPYATSATQRRQPNSSSDTSSSAGRMQFEAYTDTDISHNTPPSTIAGSAEKNVETYQHSPEQIDESLDTGIQTELLPGLTKATYRRCKSTSYTVREKSLLTLPCN
jgi:hypothetical protein